MRQRSSLRALWGIVVLAAVLWACETARNPGGVQRDSLRPGITLSNTVGDSQDIAGGLRFTVSAFDNLGLKSVRLIFSGGFIDTVLTSFTGTVTTHDAATTIPFPANSGAGGGITIIGRATDGAGNFAEDTIFIFLANVQALQVFLTAPGSGAVASTGKGIPVQVSANQNSGIRKIGFLVSPATAVTNPSTPPNDSLIFTLPFADTIVYTDTLTVVADIGFFVVEGFAEDSAGRRQPSNRVTVTIQSVVNDITDPVVSHTIGARVEVSDSITVRATDPSAIAWIGFRVRDLAGNVLRFDTVNVAAGNLTDVTRAFSLNLGTIITTFPADVVVDGYACDAALARNCAFSSSSVVLGVTGSAGIQGAPALQQAAAAAGVDTITVVAGITRPLPVGGRIADAIFNGNDSTLYLTNPSLSRVEIFQVANTAFVAAGIPTAGPQPWGIALFPRDTLGNYRDTIVVANSGGTELSIIDVSPGVRRLLWRQDLPDFILQIYKVINVGGVLFAEVTEFNISDRPQYVATVCRAGGGTACHADSVFALYSTIPVGSNPAPFTNGATLRMEKLINSRDTTQLFGHFFWELNAAGSSATTDTLRIVLRRGLPYNQTKVVLTACAGVTVDFNEFALGDTTYARNSGNFTHAFFGEGGNVRAAFARVMSYTTRDSIQGVGTAVSCFTSSAGAAGPSDAGENHRDKGMSPAVDVSDFISNTNTKVASIATNKNGATNLVRADLIYYLDEGLRLKGTSVAPSGAPGMDMNYNHDFAAGEPGSTAFGGTRDSTNRVVFAARPDANIDVFDTFFYGIIGSIPVRDPIIGPLRVARNRANNRQWLFGVTARGLTVVELPLIPNPFPAPPLASP